MFSYAPDDILAPAQEPAIAAPEVMPAAPVVQAGQPRELSQEEVSQVGTLPPSLQNALAPLIIAYKDNPAQLSAIVREALSLPDRIARGEDPAVSPELANFKAETKKIEDDKRDAMKDVASLFIAPLTLGAATAETASVANPAQQTLLVANDASRAAQEEEARRRQPLPAMGAPAASPLASLIGGEAMFRTASIVGVKDMGANMADFVDHVRDTGPSPAVPDIRTPSIDLGIRQV